MFDFAKLRGRIVEKFGSERAFAAALGTHLNTVSRKLNGKNKLSLNDVDKWAAVLGISQGEIGTYFFAKKV